MKKRKYQDLSKIVQILNSTTKMDTIVIDHDGNTLFQLINHPIPSVLTYQKNEYLYFNEILSKKASNYYFHYTNTYGLEYMAVGIWKGQSFYGSLAVGPFISSISIIDRIKDIILRNNLPAAERKHLEQFYQSLPILSEVEYKHLGELLVNMCGHDYISSQLISSERSMPLLNQDRLKVSIEENKDIIEKRYKTQNQLMDALAKGDKAEVNHLISMMSGIIEFSDRIPESPIRASKNMAFVLNTTFRIAAERGGVHPIYLHNISERFAILIERTKNIPDLNKLILLMANEYCDLVNTYATGQYSSIVKKTVDYIMLNLGNNLSLNRIATEIHVNPSYLSRKFKEETQMNISEFINQKRIEEAKLYLRRGNISVTDIAFLVGFNDLNYFSKVFKKVTSVTPSQYAEGIGPSGSRGQGPRP
ncbi:helix-turn-helix transcriptional regulator [Niallia oryzisoli]|uniref:Helix-turn-helix transcriptional regulator n=1 Tax=Niallia oryzisoli TaxID=1737571 RepID=A0ABZ2CGV8_9BACI